VFTENSILRPFGFFQAPGRREGGFTAREATESAGSSPAPTLADERLDRDSILALMRAARRAAAAADDAAADEAAADEAAADEADVDLVVDPIEFESPPTGGFLRVSSRASNAPPRSTRSVRRRPFSDAMTPSLPKRGHASSARSSSLLALVSISNGAAARTHAGGSREASPRTTSSEENAPSEASPEASNAAKCDPENAREAARHGPVAAVPSAPKPHVPPSVKSPSAIALGVVRTSTRDASVRRAVTETAPRPATRHPCARFGLEPSPARVGS
jgi:hypothetical protein